MNETTLFTALVIYLIGLLLTIIYFLLEEKDLFKGRTKIYVKYKYLYICGILFYPIFIILGMILIGLYVVDGTVDLIDNKIKVFDKENDSKTNK